MKKKIVIALTLILAFTLIFSSSATAYGISQNSAYQSSISIYQERAELFLQNIGHPATVTNPIILNNLANEPEAVLFTTSENGYIIVNINDFSIPELGFDNLSPFYNYDNPIYNGPLEYYYKQDGQIKSIADNSTIVAEQSSGYYTKQKINEPQEYLTSLRSAYQENNARYAITEKYLSAPLQEWGSRFFCGPAASAICMRYYYDNVNTIYVDSNNLSEDSLIAVMQEFVGRTGTTYTDMVFGLNSYFESRYINTIAIRTTTFSFNRVKRSILDDRPIIIGTVGHPTYGDHWIVAHGYFESRVDGNYIIINNGWGDNNIWITPSTTYLDGTIHFSN